MQILILVIEHMTHFKDKGAQLKFPQNYYSMNIVTISSRTKENLILGVCISYDKLAYTSLYCNLNNFQISSKQQLQTTKVYFLHCMSIACQQWGYSGKFYFISSSLCDWNWWRLHCWESCGSQWPKEQWLG